MTNETQKTVNALVELHVDRIERGEVENADPQSPATSAYYALAEPVDYMQLDSCENHPMDILEVLGTDVPNDWVDYWNDEPESESALKAMARRALEKEIANELERRRRGGSNG